MAPKPRAPKKKPAHTLPEKFNPGFILKDLYKNIWTIGSPIGQGGFGLIYLARKGEDMTVTNQNADYVVKIEPKDNGPLFCELHFYTNCGKEADISNFVKTYRLKHVGIPRYIASGLCEHKSKEYRFLVMDRYSKDLQTILNDNNNILNENIVLYLTRQILYALEYIHIKGYAHADIKGANLMLKNDKEIYLVDYGLAHRFSRDGSHQTYTQKPEAKHNGTIEYTSRDAHDGVPPSRRGDLEILLYCIVHWLSGTLPWLDVLENKGEVQKRKIKYMKAPKDFFKFVFQNTNNTISDKVKIFVEYLIDEVNSLDYTDEPSYLTIHNKVTETLKACGYSNDENFSLTANNTTNGKKKQNGHGSVNSTKSKLKDESDEETEKSSLNSESNIVKIKRTRNLASESVSSPKVAININGSPLVKRSKIIDDESVKRTKSPKRFTTKEIVDEISENRDGIDNSYFLENENKLNSRKLLNSPAISTLIVDDLTKNGLRSSPRLLKSKLLSNESSQFRLLNDNDHSEINNEEHRNNADDELTRRVRTPAKRTPVKRLLQSDASKTPISSPLTRAKLTNQLNENVSSPLALNNLQEESKVLIVKRRRNVPKSTIATQTDVSCLSKKK